MGVVIGVLLLAGWIFIELWVASEGKITDDVKRAYKFLSRKPEDPDA